MLSSDISDMLSEKFFGKTVLISGANGYVPAYFVHMFLGLNDEKNTNIKVLALCRNRERAEKRFEDYLNRKDFQLVIQDVCDPITISEDINIYIHAASPAGIKKRHENPVNTFLSNVRGVENMLESAVKNPCEYFLFLSSVDIYGKLGTEHICEDMSGYLDTMNVRNSYSCGKRAAESLCKAFQVKYQLPIFVVRPFQIIGPGPELTDGRLHIDFISQMLRGNEIVLKSDGSAIRSFMYITDAILAMLTVMLKGNPGEAYNIAEESGESSVKNLAEIMADCVQDRKIKISFDYEQRKTVEVTDALSVVVGNSEKIKKLGWIPKYGLKEASQRMMEYYGLCVKPNTTVDS